VHTLEEEAARTRRGTRRRAAAPMVAGVAALAGMFSLVTNNVLAVNFKTADTAYQVYTDKIFGVDGAGFLDEQDTAAGKVGVAEIGFGSAKLSGLCAIATQSLPTLGTYSLVIRAGEDVDGTVTTPAGSELSATNLYLSSANLKGKGDNITSMKLGQSADTVTTGTAWPSGMTPTAGKFGLQAKSLSITDLNATTNGIDLNGSISLPNLRIQVVKDPKTYADCKTLP
jgi:hypothetical protein